MSYKYINLKILVWVAISTALISGCKKDATLNSTKTVYVTLQNSWNEDSEFYYRGKNMLNGFALNGYAWFYGTDLNYTYDSTHNQWGEAISNFPSALNRIPVNKDFYITIDDFYSNAAIILHSTFFPNAPANHPFFFSLMDTTFTGIQQLSFGQMSKLVDISDSERIIFPVVTKNYISCYYLIDVKPTLPVVTVSNFTKVFAGSSHYTGLYNNLLTNHINNRFFVTNNDYDSTYLIRENYSVKGVMDEAFGCIFKFNGNYYSIGQYTGKIYKTTDLGETWNLEYIISIPKMVIINFDSKLIGINQDQLWEVQLGTTSIVLKEIKNDGLTEKKITDILKINNKVYILTNGGVYSRAYSDFYDFK